MQNFIEEWKMMYTPFLYVNNYTDIRYHKMNGLEIWSAISHFPNSEPMMMFGTTFSVKFHCEMQDAIVKFPFDKHSCKLEVNCSHTVSIGAFTTTVLIIACTNLPKKSTTLSLILDYNVHFLSQI